jgi:hypothetical protein
MQNDWLLLLDRLVLKGTVLASALLIGISEGWRVW